MFILRHKLKELPILPKSLSTSSLSIRKFDASTKHFFQEKTNLKINKFIFMFIWSTYSKKPSRCVFFLWSIQKSKMYTLRFSNFYFSNFFFTGAVHGASKGITIKYYTKTKKHGHLQICVIAFLQILDHRNLVCKTCARSMWKLDILLQKRGVEKEDHKNLQT